MQENKIDLLDHGFVRLVDSMGNDLSISRAARVSYNEEWKAGDDPRSDEKLIKYLWKHHHTTPFEAVTFTFEVKAPIFVYRQWHRHRTQSYNELSARYRELPEEVYLPTFRAQSKNNKQGSGEEVNADYNVGLRERYTDLYTRAFALYRDALAAGVSKELARAVLPVATYSHMFTTMNLLNLLKFLTLRCDSHAQYEIRVYADAMRELVRPIAPVCIAAWEEQQAKG